MNENIKKFIQMAANDEAVLKKMQACTTSEEAYGIAKGYVTGFTQEEFVAAMKQVNSSLAKATNDELSDDDLALVAGGKSEKDKDIQDSIIQSVSASATVTGAAAAAAAA